MINYKTKRKILENAFILVFILVGFSFTYLFYQTFTTSTEFATLFGFFTGFVFWVGLAELIKEFTELDKIKAD